MRNLKRALSLVLAMVMLLGVMMIPTGAAGNFADADQIVNKEAVEITAGMGLFAGSDGKFDPQGTVTRAQMATIIVKMLRGADFNADAFKGAGNPFTDTAAFESGWAEGYINACFQMGVVKGYGDGTFKPGNSVTTAEAVTMIINALKVDAGAGEWPLTVMAKAAEMKLFGDLKPAPATDVALVRDQLAVIVLEGLNYSPKGASGYKVENVSFVFDDMADALQAAGYDPAKITEVVGEDTLANSVYNMGVATGFITGNKATGKDYTVVGAEDFNVETGLDMVGHYVSVYYQLPQQGKSVEAYETYAVIDESTTVVVSEDLNSAKEYKAAFGRNYDLKTAEGGALDVLVFDGEYNVVDAVGGETPYIPGTSAPKGTYIIYENKVVAFLRPSDVYASQIMAITDFDGEKSYTLAGVDNAVAESEITVYADAKQGDYVTYTIAGGRYVLTPTSAVKGTVTKSTTNSDGDVILTVDGKQYVLFSGEGNGTDLGQNIANLNYSSQEYTFYIAQDGRTIGWGGASGSTTSNVNVDDIVYALGTFATEAKGGNYGEKVKKYFLQGVNTKGEEAHVLLAIEYDTNKNGIFAEEGVDEATLGTIPAMGTDQREGFYLLSDPDDKDAKKEGIKNFTRIGLKEDRNEATGNLFYGTNRYGTTSVSKIVWPAATAYNHVCSSACPSESRTGITSGSSYHVGTADADTKNMTTRTLYTDDTKFVMIYGEVGSELKTGVGGDDFTWEVPSGNTMKHPMLYRLNDVGVIEIVMVAIRNDPANLNANNSTTIFVADTTPVGSSAEGDLYTVYNASSGAQYEAVLKGKDGESAPVAGFWSCVKEEDGSLRQNTTVTNEEKLGYSTGVLTELYLSGVYNNGTSMAATFADGQPVQYVTGASVKSTKIVDLRTQDEKDSTGIATITSVQQLGNLAASGKLVTMYVYLSSKTAAGVIYVKSIANNPTGVAYVLNPTTGAAIASDGTRTNIQVSKGTIPEGFVRIESEEGFVVANAVTGTKYRIGELITGVEGSTINTQTIVEGTAKSLKVNDKTTFVDTTALGINSVAKLEAALEAGKILTIAAIGEDGDNATLIVITGQGDPYLVDGDVVLLDTATLATTTAGQVTGTMQSGIKKDQTHTIRYTNVIIPEMVDTAAITGKAAYYTVGKSGDGDVTLTFRCNYIPMVGDEFFFTTVMTAGELAEAYVLGSATESDGTKVYVVPVSGTGAKSSALHFAEMTSETKITTYSGQTDKNTTKYLFGIHDVLEVVDEANKAIKVVNPSWGHTGATSAATCCGWRLDKTIPGYYSSACGNPSNNSGQYERGLASNYTECKTAQAVSDDLVIVDLRAAVLAGTETAVNEGKTNFEALNAIKALNEAHSAVINVYSAETSTVTFLAVIDSAPVVSSAE